MNSIDYDTTYALECIGTLWYRHRGGWPPIGLKRSGGRWVLTPDGKREVAELYARDSSRNLFRCSDNTFFAIYSDKTYEKLDMNGEIISN